MINIDKIMFIYRKVLKYIYFLMLKHKLFLFKTFLCFLEFNISPFYHL